MKLEKVCSSAQCLFEQEISRTLRKRNPLAEKTRLAKLQLIAHKSHELRISLNTILGFAQMLDRCSDETMLGEERESIDSILVAGSCLMRSIDSLVDLAAMELGDHKCISTDRSTS